MVRLTDRDCVFAESKYNVVKNQVSSGHRVQAQRYWDEVNGIYTKGADFCATHPRYSGKVSHMKCGFVQTRAQTRSAVSKGAAAGAGAAALAGGTLIYGATTGDVDPAKLTAFGRFARDRASNATKSMQFMTCGGMALALKMQQGVGRFNAKDLCKLNAAASAESYHNKKVWDSSLGGWPTEVARQQMLSNASENEALSEAISFGTNPMDNIRSLREKVKNGQARLNSFQAYLVRAYPEEHGQSQAVLSKSLGGVVPGAWVRAQLDNNINSSVIKNYMLRSLGLEKKQGDLTLPQQHLYRTVQDTVDQAVIIKAAST